MQARGLQAPPPNLIVLTHPMADLTPEAARAKATRALPQVDELRSGAASGPQGLALRLDELDVPDDFDDFLALSMELRFGDGLPLVPPTPERIARMLGSSDPNASLGQMPPRYGAITLKAVASCAVMAGCRPEYLPVLVAIVRAVMEPPFNLHAVQPTTHPCAPLAVVSGPIVQQIGMNCGTDVFGPGNRPNASIGRAVRLCLRNIGGAFSGDGDMSTAGSSSKYSYVIAENVAQSPWESLAASRGFSDETNCVTVVAGMGPISIHDNQSTTGAGLLRTMAGSMKIAGLTNYQFTTDVMMLFSPEHAGTMAKDGYTREDVQRFLFAHARTPIDFFSEAYLRNRLQLDHPKLFGEYGPGTQVAHTQNWEDILVGVTGGPGKHSNFIPTFGAPRVITVSF